VCVVRWDGKAAGKRRAVHRALCTRVKSEWEVLGLLLGPWVINRAVRVIIRVVRVIRVLLGLLGYY